jgi:hypothetical protein
LNLIFELFCLLRYWLASITNARQTFFYPYCVTCAPCVTFVSYCVTCVICLLIHVCVRMNANVVNLNLSLASLASLVLLAPLALYLCSLCCHLTQVITSRLCYCVTSVAYESKWQTRLLRSSDNKPDIAFCKHWKVSLKFVQIPKLS